MPAKKTIVKMLKTKVVIEVSILLFSLTKPIMYPQKSLRSLMPDILTLKAILKSYLQGFVVKILYSSQL